MSSQSDFTLFLGSYGDCGVFHFYSRPGILDNYPHSNVIKPPKLTRVIDLEPCTHDEGSATTYTAAIRAVTMSASGVCGWLAEGEELTQKWTLDITVDSKRLCEMLQGRGKYDRIAAIVDCSWSQASWFLIIVRYRKMEIKEVIGGYKGRGNSVES